MAQYLDHTAVAQKLLDQQGDINRVTAERDGAYRERAHLVALLAAMTDGAVIVPAPDVDEDGWALLYLTIGGRQASWHISPRDVELFEHVERVTADDPRAQWDGHSTDDKYRHIAAYAAELLQHCGPACSEAHTYTGRCEGVPGPGADYSRADAPDVVHPELSPQASEPTGVDKPSAQRPDDMTKEL